MSTIKEQPILILAGSHRQAEDFARRRGMKHGSWTFLYERDQLAGLRNAIIIAVGTWRDRNNIKEMMAAVIRSTCSFTEAKD